MANYIGIDLGTAFSAVATLDETGRPVIVDNKSGENITPSVVLFDKDEDKEVVGEEARKMLGKDDENSIAIGRFKRDMGTSKTFTVHGTEYTPMDLSAMVLKKLKEDTLARIQSIEEAVVTIPANFSNKAREETMAAAKKAGLNIKYIINEPTAAALYYAFKQGKELSGNYAVYDLGGGTFDISIIRVANKDIEVLATNGVSKLGGDDFDAAVQQHVINKFKEEKGFDINNQDYPKDDAEAEKKSLSQRESCKASVSCPAGRGNIKITRNEFEELISSLLAQTEMLCEAAMDEAGLSVSDIQEVFLVGGSTRSPCIRECILRVFKKEPIATANVDEVVALGAALYAAYKSDRTNLSAIQKSSVEKIKVSEITSQCFGVISRGFDEVKNENKLQNSILITKGSKIPISVTEKFFTLYENQQGVSCKVTESLAPETDPQFVNIIWEGLLELPGGRPANQEIDVTLSYDDNQIMQCSFIDVQSGNKKTIDLNPATSAATDDDIEKFIVE